MGDKVVRSLILASVLGVTLATGALAEPASPKPGISPDFDVSTSDADPLAPKDNANALAPIAPGAPAPAAKPEAVAAAPQEQQIDPLLAQVRTRLTETRDLGKGDDKADLAGLKAYYATPTAKILWTTKDGFNAKAQTALDEIRKADDWGLEAAAFDLPQAPVSAAGDAAVSDAEIKLSLTVLKYARQARGGRFEPASLSETFDQKPRIYDPKSVLEAISATPAVDVYLQGLHPKHEGFKRLREALVALKKVSDAPAEVKIPKGPTLKAGEQHEQVQLVRQRLSVAAEPGKEALLDDPLVEAIKAYQRKQGLKDTGQIDGKLRSAFNGPESDPVDMQRLRILANMERWRWMPDDLGPFHVWNSIPEQLTRVFKDGKILLTERIVVGKSVNQTPIFSANMKFVIFHPEWGVPDGIKTNEIAPKLRKAGGGGGRFRRRDDDDFGGWFFGGGNQRSYGESNGGSSRVLQSYGLRVSYNGREVDPDSVDWSNVDIRRYQFIQPSGGRNVLGVVKFRFPNKHDVYMHDTPDKGLFGNFPRAYSHGCMRTQNPVHLAEVLLEQDKGWSAAKVRALANAESSTPDEVTLSTVIPVHVTYFTAIAGDDGKVKYFPDIYGLDSKVASAIAKRSVRFGGSQGSEAEAKNTRDDRDGRDTPRPRKREASQTTRSLYQDWDN